MNLVIVSKNKPKMRAVYHRKGCIYEQRIADGNKVYISEESAKYQGYCNCSYCKGLKGELRVNRRLHSSIKKYKLSKEYNKRNDTLYLRSEIAAWKIYKNETSGKFILYHKNKYHQNMSNNQLVNGEYHKQTDIRPSEDICDLIKYIGEHDKAKMIIMDDYRKLPRQTNKQKEYYRQAEIRHRRQSRSKIDYLFRMIEKENPEIKKYSMV